MTEFIVIYNAPKSAQDKCKNMSPDEMSKMMEAWMKWVENCGEHLIDIGTPLSKGKHLDTKDFLFLKRHSMLLESLIEP